MAALKTHAPVILSRSRAERGIQSFLAAQSLEILANLQFLTPGKI